MKVGARNRIVGKVTEIKKGKLMCLVKLEIPARSRMASVMTIESLDELGLKKGNQVEVVVKAVNVLLIRGWRWAACPKFCGVLVPNSAARGLGFFRVFGA